MANKKFDKAEIGALIVIVIIVAVIVGIVILYFTSNRWEITKKNWKTNHSEGLEREVIVSNAITGEVIWAYEGKCYIQSDSTPGDVTIMIYDKNGNIKKVDFMGDMINLQMIEK